MKKRSPSRWAPDLEQKPDKHSCLPSTTLAVLAALGSPFAAAAPCAVGTFSATGDDNAGGCTPAAPGFYVPTTGATSATIAPLGSFVSTTGASSATLAPLGFYVPNVGQSTAIQSPVGHYVPTTGASAATAAPIGSFVSLPGQSTAILAPPGTYVATTGASSATLAPLGSFVSQAGQSAAILAPPGRYVPTTGASAAILAPLGSFVSQAGQSTAILAPPGRYVPTTGASAATLAPLGSFVSQAGQSTAILAPPGRYVPTTGASSAILAPLGSFVSQAGQSAATPAPIGHYVDAVGASSATAAAAGFYVRTIGALAASPCAGGSESYGGSPACRAVLETADALPDVVSPQFKLDDGNFDLGTLNGDSSKSFSIKNDSSELGFADKVSDLTLLSYEITGSEASFFNLSGFTPGMILHEGELSTLVLFVDPSYTGPLSATLQFFTDQFASFGTSGMTFTYQITGTVASTVPTPASLGLLVSGLGSLTWWSRRKQFTKA
jgi:hypothetical protein